MTKRKFLTLFILLTLFVNPMFSQWEHCNDLEGADVLQVFPSEDLLLISLRYGGCYRNDLTGDWENISPNMKGNFYKAGNVLFNHENSNAPKRSFDNSFTWEEVPCAYPTHSLCTMDTSVFFNAGYLGFQLARSTDYMATYEVYDSLPNMGYPLMRAIDSVLFVFDEYNNLYQTLDTGNTWEQITSNGLSGNTFYDFACYNNTVLLSEHFNTFYLNETRDEWLLTGGIPSGSHIYKMLKIDGKTCGYNRYKFFEIDTSFTWSEYMDPPFPYYNISTKNDTLYFATGRGVIYQDLTGAYHNLFDGLYHRVIYSLTYNDNAIYLCVEDLPNEPSEIYKSTDNGESFQQIHDISVNNITCDETYLYLWGNAGLFKTDDDCITLEPISYPNYGYFYNLWVTDDSYYAQAKDWIDPDRFFRSPKDNLKWGMMDTTYTFRTISAIGSNVLAQGANDSGYYLSEDYGATFNKILPYSHYQHSLHTSNNKFFIFMKDSILYSNDLGNSWEKIQLSQTYNTLYDIKSQGDTLLIYISTNTIPSVQVSYDFGQSWTNITDNLPDTGSNLPFYSVNRLILTGGRVQLKGQWFMVP